MLDGPRTKPPDLDAIRARGELNLALQEHGRYIREVEARAIVATLDGLEQEQAALLAENQQLRDTADNLLAAFKRYENAHPSSLLEEAHRTKEPSR